MAIFAILSIGMAQAGIINGSFETPTATNNWETPEVADGWTWNGVTGEVFLFSGDNDTQLGGNISASDGDQMQHVGKASGQHAAIWQNTGDAMVLDQTYQIAFDIQNFYQEPLTPALILLGAANDTSTQGTEVARLRPTA